MKKLTTGEKVWAFSIALFLIWTIIGNSLGVPVRTISVFGSIGMVLFVALVLSIIFVFRK